VAGINTTRTEAHSEFIVADRPVRRAERAAFVATTLSLGVVVVGATLLRFWDLGTKSLWYDEAYSLFMARHSLQEMISLLASFDNHPPLYYVFLHGWMRIVGDGDVAARIPSAAAGVATVVVTFLLTRELAGVRVAFVAAVLLAAAPFLVLAGQEARMYPFLALFSAGASYALWRALQEPLRRWWLGYVVWMTLALYTHYVAVLVLIAHAAYVTMAERNKAGLWLRWTGIVVVASLPLLFLVWSQFATARALPAFQHPLRWRALLDLLGLLSFGGGLFGTGSYYQRGTMPPLLQIVLLLPFLALALGGLARMGVRPRAFTLAYLVVPVAVTVLVSIRQDVFQERYFSFLQPPFTIMLAAGIISLMAGRIFGRVLSLLGLVLLAGLTVAALVGASRDAPDYDWREAGRYVTAEARAGDFMLYVPPFIAIPFEHYYRGAAVPPQLSSREVLTTAKLAAQGKLRLRTTVPVAALPAIARAHPRMWIVSSAALGPRVPVGIAEVMAPFFRQAQERRFGLVSVSLWEARP